MIKIMLFPLFNGFVKPSDRGENLLKSTQSKPKHELSTMTLDYFTSASKRVLARVTRYVSVCKSGPKCSPIHFIVKMYTLISPMEKVVKLFELLLLFKKTTQNKQSPNRRKFTQSGHPGARLPMSMKILAFEELKTQVSFEVKKDFNSI
jgi:hypothetical protein